jgi:hypothetical protein
MLTLLDRYPFYTCLVILLLFRLILIKFGIDDHLMLALYIGAFTLDVKSVLNENLGGIILDGTQC